MKFHDKLQNLRKNAGMTQLELAEKLMVSRQAISKWETGNTIPDIENIISICDLFGVSLNYLVRDTHVVETEEMQECKKTRFKKRIVLISALIVIILFVGWKMNSVAVTVISIILGGFCSALYWSGRKLLVLLSKYVRKREEIRQALITIRNPVLADVFNRLGYMERKGSGFGKIISGYEFQINYNESKTLLFRSDRYHFTVVMPNLNYNVLQDVPQDKLDAQIMDLIRKDSKISTEKIAIALGVSSKTIKRHLKEMDNVNYIGRGFSGHWEIMDNE